LFRPKYRVVAKDVVKKKVEEFPVSGLALLQWVFLEQRQIRNGSVEGVNWLLTAEPKREIVARIRAATCAIAVGMMSGSENENESFLRRDH